MATNFLLVGLDKTLDQNASEMDSIHLGFLDGITLTSSTTLRNLGVNSGQDLFAHLYA